MSRHSRQMRLALIGREGQRVIDDATIDVAAGGIEGEVAARYLAGAGVGKLRLSSEAAASAARSLDARVQTAMVSATPPEAMPDLEDLDPAARSFARGARIATRALVALLVRRRPE